MTERSVAIIGKGMIGISMAVLFTGNGIPTIMLAKNAEVGLEKYRTYYRDLVGQGLVTERQAAACERRLSFTESVQGVLPVSGTRRLRSSGTVPVPVLRLRITAG